MNCDGNTITTINAKSPTASPTGINNEGLTRQQLNLISQIMQQSKQAANGQKTTAQRPRTWNMQVSEAIDNCHASIIQSEWFSADAASAQHSKTNSESREEHRTANSSHSQQQSTIERTQARAETCRMQSLPSKVQEHSGSKRSYETPRRIF